MNFLPTIFTIRNGYHVKLQKCLTASRIFRQYTRKFYNRSLPRHYDAYFSSSRLYCSHASQNEIIGRKLKTHTCGELNLSNVGETVTLRGFLTFRRYDKFILIKDYYGSTQAMSKDDDCNVKDQIINTSLDSYVEVKGIVLQRPKGQQNNSMNTGDVEILIEDYSVLSPSAQNIPILSRSIQKVNESVRMKYRYLDFRGEQMQNILKLRSITSKKIRDFLQDQMGFTEITTPTLSANTPGGAQEFVVPTRFPDQYYSLVQSPQTFKQLCMIGGVDKYFQFAVCYRDESFRSDRQPEFMQVDIEMSDITMKEMQDLIEKLMIACWPQHLPPPREFPRLTFKEALYSYGVDKPDTRFEWKIKEISEELKNVGIEIITKKLEEEDVSAHGFVIPNGQNFVSKKVIEEWNHISKVEKNIGGLNVLHITEDLTLKGRQAKYISKEMTQELIHKFSAKPKDTIVFAVGKTTNALNVLGKLRLLGAGLLESKGVQVRDPEKFNFLWVIDFPMFEIDEENGKLCSVHHPFTRPKPEHEELFYNDPLKVKTQHYDLVLNGSEIGGGSIRIHEPDLQKEVLKLLQVEPSQLGFFAEALTYGAPPHGGFAVGFDRLIAILCNKENIREVIPFPKSSSGRCLMTGAPTTITQEEKKLYNLLKKD